MKSRLLIFVLLSVSCFGACKAIAKADPSLVVDTSGNITINLEIYYFCSTGSPSPLTVSTITLLPSDTQASFYTTATNKVIALEPVGYALAATDVYIFPALNVGNMTATQFGAMPWSNLSNVPATFAPSAHTHVKANITDFPTTWAWASLTGIPSTFAPSAHTHDWTADITGKPSFENPLTFSLPLSRSVNTISCPTCLTSAPVASVFGRTGAVAAAANDYNFTQLAGSASRAQIPNTVMQGKRVTTGACATTGCSIVVTWTSAFADTNYTASCSIQDATTGAEATGLQFQRITAQVAASVTVFINNLSASTITGTVHCNAIHD